MPMKPFAITSRAFAPLLGAVLVLPPALAAPAPLLAPRSDAALATAGLRPFTPQTHNLSLEDFRRLVHPLKADLVITRVTFSPRQPRVGELVGVTLHYKNIGGKPAKDFYLRGEPGTLDRGGFGLGGNYARLAPGEEKQYRWGAITGTSAGWHTLTL